MYTRILVGLLTAALLLTAPALSQDDSKPTVAILRFGALPIGSLVYKGALDMLQAYDYINEQERAVLDQWQDLEGERINILWGNAGMDFSNANLMVKDAIGRGADVLMTSTTPVAQLATAATLDMKDPPVVIFNTVSNPYFAGVASAPCVKPAHVTGSQALTPYERIVPLLLLQDPDMRKTGTIFNSAQASGVFGANMITASAEALGLQVEQASVTSVAELTVAAEGLISKGVEAFVLPTEATVAGGLPAVSKVAADHGVPIFYAAANQVFRGATIGAGFYSFYQEGVIAARMLIGYLNGEIDMATIGINLQSGLTVGVNLDTAKKQGVEISEELLAVADFTIKDGVSSDGVTPDLPEFDPHLPDMPLEERRAADLEFLAGLYCTDEMIAEQKARLEAHKSG